MRLGGVVKIYELEIPPVQSYTENGNALCSAGCISGAVDMWIIEVNGQICTIIELLVAIKHNEIKFVFYETTKEK